MTGQLARRLQAVAALAVLLAALVGVPALLICLQQVPHHLPSLDQVLTVLRSRDTGQLAGIVLAAGVWLCWALFTVSTAAELVAVARARPVHLLHGLGVFHRPAALLIAAVVLGFTVAPATAGHATAAHPVPLPPPIPISGALTVVAPAASTAIPAPVVRETALATQDRPSPAGAAPTYRVQRRDTLWALAERYLGDPLRYPEITRLNPSAVGPDNEILYGAELVMPADATGLPPATAAPTTAASDDAATVEDVTVQPGDTLWGLSQEFTGSGRTWPQTWQLNQGRREPDGAAFTDPSLIRPGWTLTVPDVAGAPSPATTDPVPAPVVPDSAPAPETSPSPSPTEPGPTTTSAAPGSTASDSPKAESTAAGPTALKVPPTGAPGSAAPSPGHSNTLSPHSASDPAMAAFAGGGLLLAGVSLTALTRYRRRQFRHRRPGRLIPGTPPQLVPIERALYAAGDTASPDVTWLDQALRSLVHTHAEVDGARLPDAIAACVTFDTLTLVLTEPFPDAPAPWTVDADGTRWSIQRSDPLPYNAERRPSTFAPYPTLASVGRTAEGEHWLVDLERAGALALSGNRERCLDLARFLAAELAHNTWSEMLRVTLVGFGRELIPVNPDRLTFTDDLDQAVSALNSHLASVTAGMQSADVDVLTGRLRNVAGDTWAPHVVLIASSAAQDHAALSRLRALLTEQPARSAVAVLVTDEPAPADPAGWQLTMDDRGMLHLPALGLQLIANQVPADESAQLAQLLTVAADLDDRPIPPARGHEPWDAHADACGGLRSEPENITSVDQPPISPPARDLPADAAGEESPRDAASLPEDADSSAERAGSSPGDAGLSPQGSDSSAERAGSSPGDAGLSPQEADSSAERAGLSPRGAALSPQKSDSSAGRAGLSPQGAAMSPQPAGFFERGDSVLPLSPWAYLDAAATTQQDLRALAPVTGNVIRGRLEASDPALDADLADWDDPHSPRPKLTLLGPVEVRAQGQLPDRHPRRNFYTESVAYLATRPTGATIEQYATAIWPHDPDVGGKTKVRQAIAVARAWLGIDPITGRPYLPPAASDRGGRYRIDGILVDAELFRRLRLRGQARGADGIADLQAALNLVAGVPFDHLPSPRPGAPGGYSWLIDGNTRLDHEYAAMIVDVAHTVATHHLATGEPALAAAAARVALRAGSFEDVPLLDLVAACDAQGHRAEADAYVARILANHDAEVEEDLPPRTAEILYRRHLGKPSR